MNKQYIIDNNNFMLYITATILLKYAYYENLFDHNA